MPRNDGILDPGDMGGRNPRELKYFSTANLKFNPKYKIYYNSDDVVLKTDEILFPGTSDEVTYSQTYYYTDVTNSGVDHITTIEPWVIV